MQNISLPPEVEKLMDQRAGMAAIGDMDQYTKFQVAQAIPAAAAAGGDGGLAGAGMGAGIGMAMGNAMAGAMGGGLGGVAPQQAAAPAAPTQAAPQKVMVRCGQCNTLCEEEQRFCHSCGNKMFAD